MAKPHLDPTKKSKAHRNKASRLRVKLQGAQASDVSEDEKAWLAAYEASRGSSSGEHSDDGGAPHVDDVPADDMAGEGAPSTPPAGEFPDAVPPPPPPRVDLGGDAPPPGKSKGAKDASSAPPPPDGRQWFIGFLTSQWEGAMVAMTSELEGIGVKPWIAVEDLKPAVYATFEQVIPKHFKASPPMVAAVGSTGITVQYYLARKQIAEAKRAKNAKNANPGDRVAEMKRADDDAREKARAADEKKAADIDSKIGTPPPPPPSSAAPPVAKPGIIFEDETAPPTTLAIVKRDTVSKSAIAAEAERMAKDPNLVY